MRVIVASDSFKGSLTSRQVAAAVKQGFLQIVPEAEVVSIGMADGGEGLVDALASQLGAEPASAQVCDPLGRPILADYAIAGELAIMEMAACCGLPLLLPEERNPLDTSTFGLGQMILDALARGCRRFLIGIGGSATNDAGTGMLSALGWKFLDEIGNELPGTGESLSKIVYADASNADSRLKEAEFTIACDVRNPFCGPDGAAFVFAPQKGADAATVRTLDAGLRHFAGIICKETGIDVQMLQGSGAAGGLGGAFSAFIGASLKPGAELVLDALGFDELLNGASLVITGEGCMDSQTLEGKAVSAVLARSKAAGVPVAAICGKLRPCEALGRAGFLRILQVSPEEMDEAMAMRPDVAAFNVMQAACKLATLLKN